MASKTAHPGRRLIIFGLIVAALYVGVALGGTWKPKLGLDLQGGTRITLQASTTNGQDVTQQLEPVGNAAAKDRPGKPSGKEDKG